MSVEATSSASASVSISLHSPGLLHWSKVYVAYQHTGIRSVLQLIWVRRTYLVRGNVLEASHQLGKVAVLVYPSMHLGKGFMCMYIHVRVHQVYYHFPLNETDVLG